LVYYIFFKINFFLKKGILLQLVSCLQCRRCPHFFLPHLDILKGKTIKSLDESAKAVWALVRQLMLDVKSLERL
jgi:putative nucleotidyltransferase